MFKIHRILICLSIIGAKPAAASQIPSCQQARAMVCPEDVTVSEYLRCLDQKKSLFINCKTVIDHTLKAKQKAIIDTIDEAAREEGLDLDGELGLIQHHLSQLEFINQQNDERFKELGRRLAEFIGDFDNEVKPKVKEFADGYSAMAKQVNSASASSRPEDRLMLQRLEVALDKFTTEQSNFLTLAWTRASLMRGEIDYFTQDYRIQVGPHRSFLEQKGYTGIFFETKEYLDLVSKAEKAVSSAQSNLLDRHKQLHERIRIATTTLIELYVNQKTKEIMNDSRHMKSAAEFLSQMNEAIKKAFVESTASHKGLPIFTAKLDAMTAFIQYALICETQIKAPWMKEGCSFGLEKLAAARQTLKQVPSNMQLGLNLALSKSPQLGAQAQSIKDSLARKDLARAALLYDRFLREALL